ncbi:isochorismatase [Phlyctema vagabunda]|uniref:Isochorismatase n=1 Tax=Phlyctema vagabunda TaxID=108571 RepID=A0ABR4PR56_9HELO
MFEIAEGDLPFVRTRSALLALDLQNDFLKKDCLLPVDNPPDFVDKITTLAAHFRVAGDVLWFRSQYLHSRVINNKTNPNSENVITDNELPASSRGVESEPSLRPSVKAVRRNGRLAERLSAIDGSGQEDSGDDDVDERSLTETFLTMEPGCKARIGLQESPGSNLVMNVVKTLDNEKDLIFQKSHYSAFKDGQLVQTLRGRFVTEIYICGSLTNISVFATAMDAARHGYSITLIEDCCGYRSKARHDEALRQLTEFTGCDVMASADLIRELQEKEMVRQRARARRTAPNRAAPRRDARMRNNDGTALEGMMKKLALEPSQDKEPEASRSERKPERSSPSPSIPVPAASASAVDAATRNLVDESTKGMAEPTLNPPKRERVKTKIKTRRRPSNPPKPTDKDIEASIGSSSAPAKGRTSTRTTLQAASEALEKMKIADDDRSPGSSIPSLSTEESVESIGDSNIPEAGSGSGLPAPKDEGSPQKYSEDMQEMICEGDTTIISDLLVGDISHNVFERIRDEVRWQKMSHQGGDVPRLVCVQGEVGKDGSIPIYRHPADESPPLSPFSPFVAAIRKQVQNHLGHEVNHVLIQFYRSGLDHISEHSDKTLDIVPGTFIANVSLGAQRTMILRTKRLPKSVENPDEEPSARKAYRVPLPHNSMCKMGLETNMRWLHAIRQDKRSANDKSPEELAYDGGRISLTFRKIGTFLDKENVKIWGQGATSKTKEAAESVVNGQTPEAEKMLLAFGKENQSTEFDWKDIYGVGFDVLHLSNDKKLFLSGEFVADTRVKFMLAELGIEWTECSISPSFNWKDANTQNGVPEIPESLPVKFVDNDLARSIVIGDEAILMYLGARYGPHSHSVSASPVYHARVLTRFFTVGALLKTLRANPYLTKALKRELGVWNIWIEDAKFMAGDEISIVDFALWPVIDEVARQWADSQGHLGLHCYYHRMKKLESLKKALPERQDIGPTAREDLPRDQWIVKEKEEEEEEEDEASIVAIAMQRAEQIKSARASDRAASKTKKTNGAA